MFQMSNQECFTAQQWQVVKEKLATLDESKAVNVMSLSLRKPTTMLIISIFLGGYGVDRFMLGETGLGVAKLLTCGGAGIWAIIDWFLVQDKTREYNFNKFNEALTM